MAERNTEIVKKPYKYPVTFVTVVFVLLFIYLAVQILLFFKRTSLRVYNVGTAAADNVTGSFSGLVLRDERVTLSDRDGTVTYLTVSGDYSAAGSPILSIDRDGSLYALLREAYDDPSVYSSSSMGAIRRAVRAASDSYDRADFGSARALHGDIRGAVMECLMRDGGELPEGLEPVLQEETGFCLHWRDGFEGAKLQDLTEEDLLPENTERETLHSGDPVKNGGFLYKTAVGNAFSIAFLLEEEQILNFQSRKSLSVRMEDGREITGDFGIVRLKDRSAAGVISFRRYGANYLDERFVSFRILDDSVRGYKIPESSITAKSFYVVPSEYVTEGGNRNEKGLLLEDGASVRFISCTVYTLPEEMTAGSRKDVCYVYSDELKAGMTIVGEKETDGHFEKSTMALGIMASVEGVYQINRGYCVFKPVARLRNSLETAYVVVQAGLEGSLVPYDRIVLDTENVKENDIIYE